MRNHLHPNLIIIIIIILCASFFCLGCGTQRDADSNSENFDQMMYCTEIKANGEITELPAFCFSGEIYDNAEGKRCIRLEPVEISDLTFSTQSNNNETSLIQVPGREYCQAYILFYNPDINGFRSVELGFSHDYSYSIIYDAYSDRCFVCSVDPDFDPIAVLRYFLDLNRHVERFLQASLGTSIDWNSVDWTKWDWSKVDYSRIVLWQNWIKHSATPAELVEVAKSNPDGALGAAYANALGNQFLQDPQALIEAMATAAPVLQDTLARHIAGSEAYLSNNVDPIQFLSALQLAADSTDEEKAALQQIISYAEQLYGVSIPSTSDSVLLPAMMLLLSCTGLVTTLLHKKQF